MSINNIDRVNLNVYPNTFVDSSSHHRLQTTLTSIIRSTLTHLNVPLVDIFMLTHPFHNYHAGRINERVVIFINGTRKTNNTNVPIVLDNTTLFGIDSTFTKFLPPSGNGVIIKSDEGIPIAEWFDDSWELNILFDLFDNSTDLDNKLEIFTHIMKAFDTQVWHQKTIENSWKYSSQRDKLRDTFYSQIKSHREHNLTSDKRQIQQWEHDIAAYQRGLKQIYDQLFQKRQQIQTSENYVSEILSTLEGDLNILIQNEKIDDIHINDHFITIFTIPLRIYASNGKIYQGGKYTITINMFTSEVLFDSDCKHSSFWSTQDPHPHVDGTTKRACLGNIESTVAELCSQIQFYALAMILIDFLESANVSDAAGKCVVNWPEIDKDGNPVNHDDNDCCNKEEEDDDAYRNCDCCCEAYHIEDLYEVYEEVEMENNIFQPVCLSHVCGDCRDEHYHWCDEFEVFLANDAEYNN